MLNIKKWKSESVVKCIKQNSFQKQEVYCIVIIIINDEGPLIIAAE